MFYKILNYVKCHTILNKDKVNVFLRGFLFPGSCVVFCFIFCLFRFFVYDSNDYPVSLEEAFYLFFLNDDIYCILLSLSIAGIIVILCKILAFYIFRALGKSYDDVVRLNILGDLNKKYEHDGSVGTLLFFKINWSDDEGMCKDFRILDFENDVYKLPFEVGVYYRNIMDTYTDDNENNIMIRVVGVSRVKKTLILKTARTTYFNSLVTNRAMDFKRPDGRTNREIYEPGPYLSRFEVSKLSNHLGYHGFIETTEEGEKEGYILFSKKSKKKGSIGKGKWECSLETALQAKFALKKGKFTIEGLLNSMGGSLFKNYPAWEENDPEYKIKKEDIICFYRDVLEGGKPQFIFYKKINKSLEDFIRSVKEKINNISSNDMKEMIALRSNCLNDLKWGAHDFEIESEEMIGKIRSFKNYEINNRIIKKYEMMPSSLRSLEILRDFKRNKG